MDSIWQCNWKPLLSCKKEDDPDEPLEDEFTNEKALITYLDELTSNEPNNYTIPSEREYNTLFRDTNEITELERQIIILIISLKKTEWLPSYPSEMIQNKIRRRFTALYYQTLVECNNWHKFVDKCVYIEKIEVNGAFRIRLKDGNKIIPCLKQQKSTQNANQELQLKLDRMKLHDKICEILDQHKRNGVHLVPSELIQNPIKEQFIISYVNAVQVNCNNPKWNSFVKSFADEFYLYNVSIDPKINRNFICYFDYAKKNNFFTDRKIIKELEENGKSQNKKTILSKVVSVVQDAEGQQICLHCITSKILDQNDEVSELFLKTFKKKDNIQFGDLLRAIRNSKMFHVNGPTNIVSIVK